MSQKKKKGKKDKGGRKDEKTKTIKQNHKTRIFDKSSGRDHSLHLSAGRWASMGGSNGRHRSTI